MNILATFAPAFINSGKAHSRLKFSGPDVLLRVGLRDDRVLVSSTHQLPVMLCPVSTRLLARSDAGTAVQIQHGILQLLPGTTQLLYSSLAGLPALMRLGKYLSKSYQAVHNFGACLLHFVPAYCLSAVIRGEEYTSRDHSKATRRIGRYLKNERVIETSGRLAWLAARSEEALHYPSCVTLEFRGCCRFFAWCR